MNYGYFTKISYSNIFECYLLLETTCCIKQENIRNPKYRGKIILKLWGGGGGGGRLLLFKQCVKKIYPKSIFPYH